MDLSMQNRYRSCQNGHDVLRYMLENDFGDRNGGSTSPASITVGNIQPSFVSNTRSEAYRGSAPVTMTSVIPSHMTTTSSSNSVCSTNLQQQRNIRIPPTCNRGNFSYIRELYVSMLIQNPSYGMPFEDFCKKFIQANSNQLTVSVPQQQLTDAQRHFDVASNSTVSPRSAVNLSTSKQQPMRCNRQANSNQLTVSVPQQQLADAQRHFDVASNSTVSPRSAVNLSTSKQQPVQCNNSDNTHFPSTAQEQISDRHLMGQWYQSYTQNTHNITPVPPPTPQFSPTNATSTTPSSSAALTPHGPDVTYGRPSTKSTEATQQDSGLSSLTRDVGSLDDDQLMTSSISNTNNIMMYRIHNGKRYRVSAENLNKGIQTPWSPSIVDPQQTVFIENGMGRGDGTGRGSDTGRGRGSRGRGRVRGSRSDTGRGGRGSNTGRGRGSRGRGIGRGSATGRPSSSRGRGRGASGQGKVKDTMETVNSSGGVKQRGRPRKNIFETMNYFKNADKNDHYNSDSEGSTSKEPRRKKGLIKFNFKSKRSKNSESDATCNSQKHKSLTFSQNERIAIGERVKKLLYMSRLNCIKREKTEEYASDSNEKHKDNVQTEWHDETLPRIECSKNRKAMLQEKGGDSNRRTQQVRDYTSDTVNPQMSSHNLLGYQSQPGGTVIQTNLSSCHVLSSTNLQTGETSFSPYSQWPSPGEDGYDSDATIPYMEDSDEGSNTKNLHQQGQDNHRTEVIIKREDNGDGESVVQVSHVQDGVSESSSQRPIASSLDSNRNLLSGGVHNVTDHLYRFLEIDGTRFIPFQDLSKIFDSDDIKQCLKERNNDVKGKFSAIRCSDVEVNFFNKLESNLPKLQEESLLLEEELLLVLKKQCKIDSTIDQNPILLCHGKGQENAMSKQKSSVIDTLIAPPVNPLPTEITTDMRNDDMSCHVRDDDKDTVSVDEDEIMVLEEDEDDILPLELSLNENEDYEDREGESSMEFEENEEAVVSEENEETVVSDVKEELNENFESQNVAVVTEVHGEENVQPSRNVLSCSTNDGGKEERLSELIMKALLDYEGDAVLERQISQLSCQCNQSCQESHLLMTKAFLAIWKQNSILKEQVAELRSDVEKLKDDQSNSYKLQKGLR